MAHPRFSLPLRRIENGGEGECASRLYWAVAVLGCTPNSTDKSKSQPAASAQIGAVTNDPNMVVLRIKIPKSALPRDIVVPQSASGQKDVSKLSPDDVAKLSELLRTSASTGTHRPGLPPFLRLGVHRCWRRHWQSVLPHLRS